MKKFLLGSFLVVCLLPSLSISHDNEPGLSNKNQENKIFHDSDKIVQTSLSNGLTILVCPKKYAATVTVELLYNVGSKHEKDGERGIAHFIEHMVFKGTEKLKEPDIALVANKLSAQFNAFTGFDYTGFWFDIPVANWDKILPVMADCMQNCTFKQEHLNSELKTVIQELKMQKDNYARYLWLDLITNIFESHPYHYSVIGFKQDLWSVSRETLLAFYKKYYTPDNAVIVVVGDVDPIDVHKKIEKEFGDIPAGNGWNNQKFYINEDVKSKTIKLYRDVQQATCSVVYTLPGAVTQNAFEVESLANCLANGRGSRLYKLLVEELQIVVGLSSFYVDLFDQSLLFIDFSPKKEEDIDFIVQCIQKEIDGIAQHGPTLQEVERAQRFAQIEYQQLLENTQKQATAIGLSFVATRDPFFPFSYGNMSSDELAEKMQHIAKTYCTQVARHQGQVCAIPQALIHVIQKFQQESDEEDTLFLGAISREALIEQPSYVNTLQLNAKSPSVYVQPLCSLLQNGLELLWFAHDAVDTVELQLNLQANHFYDENDKQGIAYIVSNLLLEGTVNYPGQKFSDEIESYGMSLSVTPGCIHATCLKQDIERMLSLIAEMLINASFQERSLAKIKDQVSMQLKKYWDTPTIFYAQIARDLVYKNHPYSKMMLGSQETIATITLQDCIDYYKKMISPCGARCAIVGNIADKNIQDIVEKTVGQWQGSIIEPLTFPQLQDIEKQEVLSSINRDQVVLAFVGTSIDRNHEDYDKILLFDQILTGSSLSSMNSRLFQLRVQSGLFYTIAGSLLFQADEQPGMIFVRTIVSQDKVEQAEKAILKVIDEAIDSLTAEELQDAKRAIASAFDRMYESNEKKAATFLFLKKYNLPFDYFEQRAKSLEKMTIEEVQAAVKKMVSIDKLAVIKVGRV